MALCAGIYRDWRPRVREHNSPAVAVVLAAGAGTRLGAAQSRIPKPLTNLLGVPLLNRALRSRALLDQVLPLGAPPTPSSDAGVP